MKVDYRTLDTRVIAVAKEGAIGDWAAYIGAVPGNSHENEWPEVAASGSKLPESVANALFPHFARFEYRG